MHADTADEILNPNMESALLLDAPTPMDAERRRWCAILAYAESRSELFASRASGLHHKQVKAILAEPGIEADIQACRDGIRMGIASGYMDLQIIAQRRCMERLMYGDVVMSRSGLVTVPVRARDAATIFKLAGERHDILTGNIAPAAAADARLVELAGHLMEVALTRQQEVLARAPLPPPDDQQSLSIQDIIPKSEPESESDFGQVQATSEQSLQQCLTF